MKSVLISTRPEWVEKIVNGEKTIEVRKSAPKEVPFKAYIYCTKEKKQDDIIWAGAFGDRGKWNGHIIGEFICDKIDDYAYDYCDGVDIDDDTILETAIEREDINIYAKGKILYGWHISDLKIYDKPKELSEFWGRKNCIAAATVECWNCFATCLEIEGKPYQPLTRPPQSWQYVEELEK